jgi:hypothetical protein
MANKGTTGKKFQRSPVLLGKFKPPKTKKNATPKETEIYSSVTQNTIDGLSLTIVDDPKSTGDKYEVRGTKGAGSIKVSITKETATKPAAYFSIPVPGWFKIADMRAFVKTKITKATHFTAPSGRVYSVGKSSGTT